MLGTRRRADVGAGPHGSGRSTDKPSVFFTESGSAVIAELLLVLRNVFLSSVFGRRKVDGMWYAPTGGSPHLPMNLRFIALVSFGLAAIQAQAATIFSDNFNSANGGVGALNYAGFANWTVSDGTVDLIGNGFFDFFPANGLYIDMDGSTGNAGKLTSIELNLAAGDYLLSYDLAGNQRNSGIEQVNVGVTGTLASTSHSLAMSAPFQTFSLGFSLLVPGSVFLTFEGTGNDNVGMLLDNVLLVSVEQPGVPDTAATVLLLSLGVGVLLSVRARCRL